MRIRKALHRREASLLRRAAVVRRASCGLQRQAGCRVSRQRSARLRSLSLGRRCSTRGCSTSAPRRAGCRRRLPIQVRHTSERPLSFGARPWCDVPASASNANPAAACQGRAQHAGARCLWGDSAAPELAACARCAALGTAGLCPIEGRCIGGDLSRSVRNRSATCQLPLSMPSKSTRVGTLPFWKEAQHPSLLRAHAVSCWLWWA